MKKLICSIIGAFFLFNCVPCFTSVLNAQNQGKEEKPKIFSKEEWQRETKQIKEGFGNIDKSLKKALEKTMRPKNRMKKYIENNDAEGLKKYITENASVLKKDDFLDRHKRTYKDSSSHEKRTYIEEKNIFHDVVDNSNCDMIGVYIDLDNDHIIPEDYLFARMPYIVSSLKDCPKTMCYVWREKHNMRDKMNETVWDALSLEPAYKGGCMDIYISKAPIKHIILEVSHYWGRIADTDTYIGILEARKSDLTLEMVNDLKLEKLNSEEKSYIKQLKEELRNKQYSASSPEVKKWNDTVSKELNRLQKEIGDPKNFAEQSLNALLESYKIDINKCLTNDYLKEVEKILSTGGYRGFDYSYLFYKDTLAGEAVPASAKNNYQSVKKLLEDGIELCKANLAQQVKVKLTTVLKDYPDKLPLFYKALTQNKEFNQYKPFDAKYFPKGGKIHCGRYYSPYDNNYIVPVLAVSQGPQGKWGKEEDWKLWIYNSKGKMVFNDYCSKGF